MLCMLPIMLVLYSNMNNNDVKILLLGCSIRVFMIRNRSVYAFECILNVLLERIELVNTVPCIFICADCSIREYQSDFSPLY